jgi:predicted metal-binding membrane protein
MYPQKSGLSIAMERIHLILIISLVFVSIVMWIITVQQYDTMMYTMMMFQDPLSLSIFTVIWTAGMAAMMFPAISPMVLLYDRLIKTNNTSSDVATSTLKIKRGKESSLDFHKDNSERHEEKKRKMVLFPGSFWSPYTLKMLLFIGSYLSVWAVTGIALLIGWSITMSYIFTESVKGSENLIGAIFGLLLVISGLYQFSPLKTKCLGYCESPLSFFMRRWRRGIGGAITMGTYHGLYCLGCCWPYFLLMVALGWMNVLWMGIFAAIIFGEKVWIRGGKWVARGAGVGFLILGVSSIFGIIEIPTGDMTTADLTRGNKDMGMKKEMNQGTGTNLRGAQDDMQMNMEMNNSMVMNNNST